MEGIVNLQRLPDHVPQKVPVLNSWKEIAVYLGRGVRTAQRWEQELSLPVRRPRGKSRSAVFAFAAEIDEWLKRSPFCLSGKTNFAQFVPVVGSQDLPTLLQESRELRRSLREGRRELRVAVSTISQTIAKIEATKSGQACPSGGPGNLTPIPRR